MVDSGLTKWGNGTRSIITGFLRQWCSCSSNSTLGRGGRFDMVSLSRARLLWEHHADRTILGYSWCLQTLGGYCASSNLSCLISQRSGAGWLQQCFQHQHPSWAQPFQQDTQRHRDVGEFDYATTGSCLIFSVWRLCKYKYCIHGLSHLKALGICALQNLPGILTLAAELKDEHDEVQLDGDRYHDISW